MLFGRQTSKSILIALCDKDEPFPKVIVNFQENAIQDFNKYIFSRISGRVLWPLVSKSPTQNCINNRDLVGSHTWRSGSGGPGMTLTYRFWSSFSVLLLAVPSSVYPHQPQAEHKGCSVFQFIFVHLDGESIGERVTSGKPLRQVKKKHHQQMCPHLPPDCYSLPFRACGIL